MPIGLKTKSLSPVVLANGLKIETQVHLIYFFIGVSRDNRAGLSWAWVGSGQISTSNCGIGMIQGSSHNLLNLSLVYSKPDDHGTCCRGNWLHINPSVQSFVIASYMPWLQHKLWLHNKNTVTIARTIMALKHFLIVTSAMVHTIMCFTDQWFVLKHWTLSFSPTKFNHLVYCASMPRI